MRSRDAWVTIFATALGVDAGACNKPAPAGSDVGSRELVSLPAPVTSDAAQVTVASATPSAIVDASPIAVTPPDAGHAIAPPIPTEHLQVQPALNPNIRAICGAPANPQNYADPVAAPRVDVQTSLVSSGHPNDARVIAGMRPTFRACFAKELELDPSQTGGKATVNASIDANGDVTNASISAPTMPAGLTGCLLTRVRRSSFDPNAAHAITFSVELKKQ